MGLACPIQQGLVSKKKKKAREDDSVDKVLSEQA